MAKSWSNGLKVVLVGAALVGVWKAGEASLECLFSDDTASADHFENRPWLERVPEHQRDMIGHMIFLNTRDGRYGAFGRSSTWRHFIEVFLWNREEGRVRFLLPQDRKRGRINARTWECDEAPEPFDLCLELSDGRHSVIYYSHSDWEVDPNMDGEDTAEWIADHATTPELAAAFEQALDADKVPMTEVNGEGFEPVQAPFWAPSAN